MKRASRLARACLYILLALFLSSAAVTAAPILEIEPNNTFGTAQLIPSSAFTLTFNPNIGTGSGAAFVNTSTTIPNVTIQAIASPDASVDYFRFTTTAPGIIILDIDSTPVNTNFDTMIFLFNALAIPLFSSDDNNNDPGDGPGIIGGAFNSRIETPVLPAGDYVAAVSQFFAVASPGGGVTNAVPAGGTYTLNVSAQVVPEPATLLLFGAGFAGLTAFRRRQRH
jgi:hypothetical protein